MLQSHTPLTADQPRSAPQLKVKPSILTYDQKLTLQRNCFSQLEIISALHVPSLLIVKYCLAVQICSVSIQFVEHPDEEFVMFSCQSKERTANTTQQLQDKAKQQVRTEADKQHAACIDLHNTKVKDKKAGYINNVKIV